MTPDGAQGMSGGGPVRIGVLAEEDVRDAMQLVATANWNQTRRDWQRVLRLAPQGCFGAWSDDGLLATITTTTYGTKLAWIGMMFVSATHRRRGIAMQLMRVAMDYLTQCGVTTIKLDATLSGRPLYEALGFEPELVIERWEGTAQSLATESLPELRESAWAALQSLDGQAFQADRASLLTTLAQDSCVTPLTDIAPDGRLRGFALARDGAAAQYLGPLVALNRQVAVRLLDSMISQLTGKRVYVDVHTGFGIEPSVLFERNLSRQRELVRMQFGAPSTAGTSAMVFAIAGPELG